MPILNRIRTVDWQFSEEPQTLVLTSRQVLEEKAPILLASRDADGSWRFLHGTESGMADVRFVTLDSLVTLDLSLHELAQLPPGQTARRAAQEDPWATAHPA